MDGAVPLLCAWGRGIAVCQGSGGGLGEGKGANRGSGCGIAKTNQALNTGVESKTEPGTHTAKHARAPSAVAPAE